MRSLFRERVRVADAAAADGSGASVVYERREVRSRQLERDGWPADLARIRRELPAHLYDSPPAAMARKGSRVVVATAGREAIGFAWAIPAAGDERCAYVEEVAVIRQRQRQGVGSQLLRETATWMLELGFETMLLYPISDGHWVSRLGFEPVVGGSFLIELAKLAG